MKRFSKIIPNLTEQESGQAIVIVAAALVVLIGFTGLAIDLGYVWMRQAQLKSIVDSAALAGAPELGPTAVGGGIASADQNALQYLATNQLLDTNDVVPLEQVATSFESAQGLSPLGAREYTITVTWDIPLFFMPIFGFDQWKMTESSTAAYFPLVDLYSGRRVALDGVTTSTQAIFGPNQVTSFGDAFSPFDGQGNAADRGLLDEDGDFSYTYRVEIPKDYDGTVFDTVNSVIAPTYIVRIELLDPDSINNEVPAGATLSHSEKFRIDLENSGATNFIHDVDNDDCSSTSINNPCIIQTCEWEEGQRGRGRCNDAYYVDAYDHISSTAYAVNEANPFWFYRLDENRHRGGTSDAPANDTVTIYTLYYFQKRADGSIVRQDLASYAGQSRVAANMTVQGVPPVGQYHASTDLNWVSPGAWNEIGFVPTTCQTQSMARGNGGFAVPGYGGCAINSPGDEDVTPDSGSFGDISKMGSGFEINVLEDIPDIVVDQVTDMMHIYIDVNTVSGTSENGFEIWAGPPHAHYGFDSNVNQRNLLITDKGNLFGTDGVSVYSSGILPLNSMTGNRVDFPLVYVSPEYAGQTIDISLFDADSGTSYPLCFYFDTIPNPDCETSFNAATEAMDGYLQYYDGDNDGGRCFPGCNNLFVEPPFYVNVPTFNGDCNPDAPFEERMLNCNAFLGGRLMVSYDGGQHDTYQWIVNFPSVPYIKN